MNATISAEAGTAPLVKRRDLLLVRRANVADEDAGEEHGEEARAVQHGAAP